LQQIHDRRADAIRPGVFAAGQLARIDLWQAGLVSIAIIVCFLWADWWSVVWLSLLMDCRATPT
jgi:hypothetical protein